MDYIFLILAQFEAGPDGRPGSGLFGFDWSEVIATVLTMIGTGIAGWWALKAKRTISAEEQKVQFYEIILKEHASLRVVCDNLQTKLIMLQTEVEKLRKDLLFYEENHLASNSRAMIKHILNSSEIPEWIHDLGTNKWYINTAYATYFNVHRQDFWTPINILARYPDIETLEHLANDLSTVAAGTEINFEETLNKDIMNPKCKYKMRGVFKKSPFRISDNNYIYGKLLEILEDNIPTEK